jgi:transcriptional regulator with PAS, ATPase and Fis domain
VSERSFAEYEALVAKVDSFAAAVHERRAADLACKLGCAGCCRVELTVTAVEAGAIERHLAVLAPDAREKIGRTDACVFLDPDTDGCLVYAARPFVCRTQGLPLRYPRDVLPVAAVFERDERGDRTWCPLNFEERMPAAADVLDCEHLDLMTGLVDARYRRSEGREDASSDGRITLRDLAGAVLGQRSIGSPHPSTDVVASATPMASESSELAAHAETHLPDGTKVALTVEGVRATEFVAQRALDAASLAVAKAMSTLPERAEEGKTSFAGIVGASTPMRDLAKLLERIKGSNATVLITGENGTGKELVARAIHDQSSRAGRRFVATNCSAFNDNLLESELFGHKRGSFTGAVVDKPGLFEVADGGTFFLDEVGDMSPALQVKLLRVLQESVFMPVGGTEPKKVDVRIIAATNRDLAAMQKKGEFREDLYYRLHVVAVRVPALRDRKLDIPLLADHFMARLAKRDGKQKVLSQRALERLLAHDWPGNVRELENEIERLWVLSGDDSVIDEEHLTPLIRQGGRQISSPSREAVSDELSLPATTLPEAVETLERKMILAGLRRAKGNKTRAAEDLGISRRNLIRKVQAYGLDDALNRKGSA